MIVDKVNTLLGLNKLEEAISLLLLSSAGPLSKYKSSSTLLLGRFNQYKQDVIDGVGKDEVVNQVKLDVIQLAQTLDTFGAGLTDNNITELLACSLVIEDSFPFIDRTQFRKKIKKALLSENANVILVQGTSQSGMSYLEKYLKNIADNLSIFTLVPMEIPAILGEPDIILGEKLAKSILNKVGVQIQFDPDGNEQFKFTQFINSLKDRVKDDEKIPLFFLHDFHKIEDNNENLLEFIFALIHSIRNDLPKCIFVIAGFNYNNIRNWHNDLKFTTPVYNIEDIKIEDVKVCLTHIFSKYENKIRAAQGFENISEEEYINGMIEQLGADKDAINIATVGLGIAEHLMALKD